MKDGIRKRLADSVETALELGKGIIKVEVLGKTPQELMYSEKFACIDCGVGFAEISPRMFSFNNPYGACTECSGLGVKRFF